MRDAVRGKVNPANDCAASVQVVGDFIRKLEEHWESLPVKEQAKEGTKALLSVLPFDRAAAIADVFVVPAAASHIEKPIEKVCELGSKIEVRGKAIESARETEAAIADGCSLRASTEHIVHQANTLPVAERAQFYGSAVEKCADLLKSTMPQSPISASQPSREQISFTRVLFLNEWKICGMSLVPALESIRR